MAKSSGDEISNFCVLRENFGGFEATKVFNPSFAEGGEDLQESRCISIISAWFSFECLVTFYANLAKDSLTNIGRVRCAESLFQDCLHYHELAVPMIDILGL